MTVVSILRALIFGMLAMCTFVGEGFGHGAKATNLVLLKAKISTLLEGKGNRLFSGGGAAAGEIAARLGETFLYHYAIKRKIVPFPLKRWSFYFYFRPT